MSDTPGKHVAEVRGPGLTGSPSATSPRTPPAVCRFNCRQMREPGIRLRPGIAAGPRGGAGPVRAYSNPSIGLLGFVTARALKGDFAALMREHVLTPLSLNDTFYSIPQTAMARYAQGQTRDGRSARITQAVLATEAYVFASPHPICCAGWKPSWVLFLRQAASCKP